MRPYEKLKGVYETASRMIVRSEAAWKDYLSFAARFHKYSFDNALLVYAQNPDVTALASIPQWNKVGRNVNKSSKGIAVCEYENAKLTLSYLFDISQTGGREIKFLNWQLDDNMKSEVADRLIRADDLTATDFNEAITELAGKNANENYESCLRSVMANSENHIFSELPKGGFEAQLISLISDSIVYFIGKRCGLNDNDILLEGGMTTVSDFNRIPLIAALGNTVTKCARDILIEMELTIKTVNAERKVNYERKETEYRLHGDRRNTVSESANIQRTDSGSAARKVRQNGNGVSERELPRPLYSFENGWQPDDGNALGSADSHRENRKTDAGNAVKRADPRNRGYTGADAPPEQSEAVSRGNGNKGNRTDTEIKTENAAVTEPPKDGSVRLSENNPKAEMSDDEIVRHYETVLMSTDIYPIELHRRLYLILKDEPNNGDWQSVSGEVYSVFAEYGNREYKGEVLYRTELVNKDGISIYFGEDSTYLPWIFVANIINAMIVDGVYPGDFTQLFEEARRILEKAEYVVSDEYLMTAVLELQKEKIYNPTVRQIAEQTEAVIVRDAENIEDAELSAVEQSDNENSFSTVNEKEENAAVSETDETPQLSLFGEITDGGQTALTDISSDDKKGEVADKDVKSIRTPLADEIPEYENAPPGTKNFTFVIKEDNIYYCEKDKLIPQNYTGKKAERIKGLCGIRTALLDVINLQSGYYEESELKEKQQILNKVYDAFVKKCGAIGSNANILVFSDDDQFPLLRSIENEIENSDGTKSFEKAQIFYKATIRPQKVPTSADTAEEALYISLNTKLRVDIRYMSQLTGKPPTDVIGELGEKIYLNPQKYNGNISEGWETAEEYLSGHVKDKLVYAEYYAEKEPELFSRNVRALEEARPIPLSPSDISAPIGAPWIPIEYYRQFMYETFDTPSYFRAKGENDNEKDCIILNYMEYTTVWRILNKFYDRDSVKVCQTFGTSRKNAYEIFEDSLNQQMTTVKDKVTYLDENGYEKEKYVINPNETRIARAKQTQIKEAFAAWLWKDAERKEDLLQIYNNRFNTVVPRVYDGSHLTFPGMSDEMKLRPHQMNFAARVIYSGTGLAAHEVGAGKTAALIAAGMFLKNIGAVKKPVYVVPNPLVGQWATEFYRFFPNANLLVSTSQDFTAQNRNRYVSRIAMGDYDAVILAHSQFERIPISAERQIEQLENQISQLSYAIGRIKEEKGENWTVKQMVAFQKNLSDRLERLSAAEKKDDLLTFEQLGIDFMFVDEAHMFKNCFIYTKMSRVAGINTSSSQRAFDMLNKCQYLQEINNGRGVVFATGTPVSNSMTEMYVMMRYLEPDELKWQGLSDFDSWAATYGEVVSSLEITPEGGGYRMRQRFAKFHNLPELMQTYRLVADVQTAEMLNLPRPGLFGGKKEIISSAPTEYQKKIMAAFIERAEAIRNGSVKPYEDNMLKLTNEARQMAIDPRLIDKSAPNDPDSKLNMCIEQIYKIWKESETDRLTQLVFCDVSTPTQNNVIQTEDVDGVYKAIPNQFTNVYDEIKRVLTERGVPENEIVFIHDAKTEVQRQAIFEKTRKGEIRILLGSTGKLGTGVNVQDRVIALHHLDVPWKPSDITQRDGRGLRQGNMNKAIHIYHYIAEGTFGAYLWQIQEQKLRFITQVTTAKNIARSCEDIDETVLTAAQFKAIATDNPQLLEKMELENRVSELRLLQRNHQDEQALLERKITQRFPNDIENCKKKIEKLQADLETLKATDGREFSIILKDRLFTERVNAGEFLLVLSRGIAEKNFEITDIGEFRGLKLQLEKNSQRSDGVYLKIIGSMEYDFILGDSDIGNITRIENSVNGIAGLLAKEKKDLENTERQLEAAKGQLGQPFIYEAELAEKSAKLTEIDTVLELGNGDEDTIIEESSYNENGESKHEADALGAEM